MTFVGEQTEHAGSIFVVSGLAQNFSFNDHNSIRSEHVVMWPVPGDGMRFRTGKPQSEVNRLLSGSVYFWDLFCLDLKSDTSIA
jgi:hypothetical protein